MLRTTTALTIVQRRQQGQRAARAAPRRVVNFRLLPGDTPTSVVEHVERTVGEPAHRGRARCPGVAEAVEGVAATDGAGYQLIERTMRELFPDAVVAPG